MFEKTILVLNMGMKSIRSIIFDNEGNKLASFAMPIETSLTGDTVTQEPSEWWEKACLVIKETVAEAGNIPVDYLTVTTSSSCLVCVDKEGEPLFPCMMVSDKRAGRESELLKKMAVFQKVKEKTGLGADPSLIIPKILWVKRNRKEIFSQVHKFLSPNDFLIAKLTGCYVTDYMNAHKWHYDMETCQYPLELLQEIQIDKQLLPEVVAPGTYIGNVLPAITKQTGLSRETRVIATTYDAICSFIGSGTLKEGEASDVSGTVTVFRAVSGKRIEKSSDKIQQLPYYEGGIHIIGGSNNLGGGLIEWVKQCYYSKEEYPYEVMEKEAAESDIGARGIVFLPYLLGERAPIWNDNARGTFFGLDRMHTRRDMTRAVFESAAFIDRTMMEAIGETSADVTSIRLSGGLARVNLISQIKADVTGKEIIVLSEFETTASGAAMMVLNGQKGISFRELARHFSKSRMTIYPDMENHEKYNVVYKLFKETYQQLLPMFDRRIELLSTIRDSRETQIENL